MGKLAGVRFGSKADMCSALGDVRLVPKADITPLEPPLNKLGAKPLKFVVGYRARFL